MNNRYKAYYNKEEGYNEYILKDDLKYDQILVGLNSLNFNYNIMFNNIYASIINLFKYMDSNIPEYLILFDLLKKQNIKLSYHESLKIMDIKY